MLSPNISPIHTARRLALSGQAQEALAMLDSIGEIDFATFYLVRGECFYILRQFAEARDAFKMALQLAPNSPRAEILLELANEMVMLGTRMKPQPSISQLIGSDTTEDFPKLPLPTSKNGGAVSSPLADSRPDEIGLVSETLAGIMARQGKFEEARKVYIQLSRLNPDRYDYFHTRMEELEERMRAEG